ncbi:MAG: glycoside hydrolase, partial [Deltaproteobacteria bacterium]|nr:glycoside hydrolase [Deltaproteobacteria bacterium]
MRKIIVKSAVIGFALLFAVFASGRAWAAAIHVVWEDSTSGSGEIYFRTSADNGATWSANKWLTNNTGWSRSPSIAVNGSNIHVAWHDDTPGNYEIYFKTSADNGATWSAAKRLTNNTGWSASPSIAVNGSNIHVAWQDNTPGNFEIYFKTSADGGATWSANKRLTNNTGESRYPSIAINGSNIHVAWVDDTPGNFEIYFMTSADNGATWSANKRLTHNTGWSRGHSIAVNGSNIHVAWMEDTPGNLEIYFKTSADGGATWSANKRLTNNTGWSRSPSIAVNGSNIHVAWHDDTPGN